MQKLTHRCAGFTLIEMLIVIGLIMMAMGIVLGNFDRLVLAMETRPVASVFRDVAAEARYRAASGNQRVELGWDAENVRFFLIEGTARGAADDREGVTVADGEGGESEVDELLAELQENIDATQETEVLFFPLIAPTAENASSPPEVKEAVYATEPVQRLVFDPGGSGMPARIVIRDPGEDDQELTLDVFSAGPANLSQQGGTDAF